jgi:PEP-CTERM motif
LYDEGSLSKVVDLSDEIEGKTIASLGIGRVALSGDMVVFSAEFTDGSSGIFETNVPEPGMLAAIGLVCLAGMRRRLVPSPSGRGLG